MRPTRATATGRALAVTTLAGLATVAAAQPSVVIRPPEVVVPEAGSSKVDANGLDIRGNAPLAPGAFPRSVVSARWDITTSSNYILGSQASDLILAPEILSGPAPFQWTAGATNEGDLDANIIGNPEVLSRGQAGGGNYALPQQIWHDDYPQVFTNDGFKFEDLGRNTLVGDVNYGWTVSYDGGVAMVSVAQNGVDYGQLDDVSERPTGTLYGIAGATWGGRGGDGYSMLDGTLRDGQGGMYLGMMNAGAWTEFAFDVATVWFPYAEGWLAATFDNDVAAYQGGWYSPRLPDDASEVITRGPESGAGRITLPGYTADDGILFIQSWSSTDSNQGNISRIARDGDGFRFSFVEDLPFFERSGDDGFQMVFVPFNADGMIGAYVDAQGSVETGTDGFTLARVAAGTYEIAIDGAAGESGVLLLQTVEVDAEDRAFLSYEFDASRSVYVVQARTVQDGDNVADESYPLTDAAFAFAYVDFENPVSGCDADFDVDGDADVQDLLTYLRSFRAGGLGADRDYDADSDVQDLLAYLRSFRSGC